MQRVPELLSYLQVLVDEQRRNGRFVLTGSQNLALAQGVSQSLAGRTAMLQLLPLAHDEVLRFRRPPKTLESALLTGGYPRILDQEIEPVDWLASYVSTFVERDLRQLLRVGDLAAFQTFLRLCAGRSGRLLNLSAAAADCGVVHNTARAWLSVLEASYIVTRVLPLPRNVNKRLIKAPKIYLLDSGLMCYLLDIRTVEQLRHHPLRGQIFETWVVSEILKSRWNRASHAPLFFYRDAKGVEVDLVVEQGDATLLVEIKSGRTVAADAFKSLDAVTRVLGTERSERLLVQGGDDAQRWSRARVIPWHGVPSVDWVG